MCCRISKTCRSHVVRNSNTWLVFEQMKCLDAALGKFSKLKYSVHSKWAHIKLNRNIWCRAGTCGLPLDFFGAGMGYLTKMDLPRAVHPPGWGLAWEEHGKILALTSSKTFKAAACLKVSGTFTAAEAFPVCDPSLNWNKISFAWVVMLKSDPCVSKVEHIEAAHWHICKSQQDGQHFQ